MNGSTPISEAAGNTFSHNGVQYGDLNNEDSWTHRYYYSGNLPEEPFEYDSGWVPVEDLANTTCSELLCEPPCPIIIHEPEPDKEIVKDDYLIIKDDWDNTCTYYMPYPHNPYITSVNIDPIIGDQLTGLQQLIDPLICTGLQTVASNSTGINEVDYYWWLNQINSFEGHLWLASEYASDGNFTQSDNIINTIPNKWPLQAWQMADFNNYVHVYNVIKSDNFKSLSNASINTLQSIYSQHSGYASEWAANILNANGIKKPIRYYLPSTIRSRSKKESGSNSQNLRKFGVYPNPSTSKFGVCA